MSSRRSRPRQSTSPPGTRLAGSPRAGSPRVGPGWLPPVPLVLALLLCGLLLVMLSGAHLASAARLTPWLEPSPLPALSPAQTGKLVVLAGLAALTGGILLLLGQWPQTAADRKLRARFAWLLLPGGGLVAGLELAQILALDWPGLQRAEEVGKWAVFAGCGAILGWRLLGWRSLGWRLLGERFGRPPDRAD